MTQSWRVKYDGICSRCGIALVAGTPAVYDRASRTTRCIECPPPAAVETVAAAAPGAPASAPEVAASVAETAAPAALEPRPPAPDPGVAGGPARREYERRIASREARTRDRFGHRLGGLILALTSEPQSTRAWAIGAKGEEKLAKALEGIEGLRVLHDRRVPGTRGNIDHIVVAPAGVFVVNAKRYQGKIEIRNRGWFLRPDYPEVRAPIRADPSQFTFRQAGFRAVSRRGT